jgi:hypothetical protein
MAYNNKYNSAVMACGGVMAISNEKWQQWNNGVMASW